MGVDRGRAWSWYLAYKGQSGQWAQLLHRVTGLGVALFLLLHIVDTALLGWGPAVFDAVSAFWSQPLFLVLEVMLAGAVIYHAVNGIRVTIIDFWDLGSLYQERLFWATIAISLLLFVPAAAGILSNLFR